MESSLAAAGPDYAIFAAEIGNDGAPIVIHETNVESSLAIGSCFKLYVLAAIAGKIETGELDWTTDVELTEALRSYPTGVTQHEFTGTMLPIDELARRMISISDNTAADMLMVTAGRDACESALTALENSTPERTIPMLMTRELFSIKLGNQAFMEQFAAADVDERRILLASLDERPSPAPENVLDWTTPRAIDSIEWFATMPDLGRAMTWLWARSDVAGLEPIKEILTLSPGVNADPAVWTTIAAKGGSEIGVLALAWLLERADGKRFTFTCAVNNPEAALKEDEIIHAVSGAFPLLAMA